MQKGKMVVEEAIQIAVKRREVKSKEEKERYRHSALLTMPKPLTVENSERDGNTRPPDLPLEKSVCRSGSNS